MVETLAPDGLHWVDANGVTEASALAVRPSSADLGVPR
jgi:hypothetical protein